MPTARVHGTDLYYEAPRGLAAGEGTTVLVLVHGFGGSVSHFAPLLPRLAEQTIPVALDLPGHGRSSGTVPMFLEGMTDYLIGFLDWVGLRQPVCYLGHSLGGLVGLHLYSQHPGRVRALMLVASAPRIRLHPALVAQVLSGDWRLDDFLAGFAPDLPEARRRLILDDFLRLRLSEGCDTLSNWAAVDMAPLLGSVRVPVLVTVPEKDVIISPRKGRLMARQIPGARLHTVAEAGHYVHVERPAAMAGELNLFLSALGADRRAA